MVFIRACGSEKRGAGHGGTDLIKYTKFHRM